ncbi:nif11-like leader peptide domain protein [Thiorhodovibrio winogradskyi]|uniref:Nif11-like leader peptide domain protein n=1 Tax=Thiorhodovibrio winogradskyi TaxID=77007 RepID=A0ABZ0S655_9GAMM|nr:hypothetical protein [Thiorhodovibrio winogradskyi]
MSTENVKLFFAALAADPEHRLQLQQLNNTYRGRALDEQRRLALVREHVLPVAEAMGFPFTADDLKDYEAQTLADIHQSGQLSSEELDVITGGSGGDGLCHLLGVAPNISPYWLNGCPLGI